MLIAVFALVLSRALAPAEQILGQWESVTRTPGGVGNILEFFADGRVTQVSAAMGDATYDVQGEWLRTFWRDPKTGKVSEVDTRLDFEGNMRFSEKAEDGSGETWSVRVGEPVPGGSPLGGQWCALYMEALPTYREFTRDKTFNRMPIAILRGRYSLADKTMTVTIDGQPPGQYPFRVEKGLLVLQTPGGVEKQYRRPDTSLLRGY